MSERPRRSALELQAAATGFAQFALESREAMATVARAADVVARMLDVPVVMLVRPVDGDRAEIVHAIGPEPTSAGQEVVLPAELLAAAGTAAPPRVIGDWLAESRLAQPAVSRRLAVRSSLLVNLPTPARPHLLVVEDTVARAFRTAEVDAVTAVAQLLAAALERHRQEAAQAAVAAFGQFALESRSADVTLQRAVDLATEILDAPIGFVLRVDAGPGAAYAGDPPPAGARGGAVRVEVLHGRGPLDEPLDGELEVPAHLVDQLRAAGPLLADWPVIGAGPAVPGGTAGVSVGVRVSGQTYRLGVGGAGPHRFPVAEVDALASIAHLMAVALERDRAVALLRATSNDLQRALLPAALPAVEGIEAVARYVSAGSAPADQQGARHDRVGGDWYDVLPLPNGGVGLVMGDVEGHDSGAAAVMGQMRNVLRAYVAEGYPPAEVLTRVNRFVSAHTDLLVTCCYAELHPQDLTVRCTSAGHPMPVVLERDGTLGSLDAVPSLPLGVDPDEDYTEHTTLLSAGCCLLLVTDGLVADAGAIHPGEAAFRAAAAALVDQPLERLADLLTAPAAGRPGPRDDAALLAVRLVPDAMGRTSVS
ncbi:MAG TPA: SpoIIE family protein phosphatase [Kineosporiaceae bacterium]